MKHTSKHSLFATLLLGAASVFAAHAQTFVGYMAYSSSWAAEGAAGPQYGWYSYDLTQGTFTQRTYDEFTIKACKGGTCAEGRLYAMESATDSWLFPDPKLNIYNAETYKLERTVSYGRSDRDHATKDFAVNPADHQLYAIAQHRDGNTADGGWIQHYNLEDGTMTRIAHLPSYQHALAISADGTFYTLAESGTLYRVSWDEHTLKDFADYGRYPEATLAPIGHTGYRMQNDLTYANSLCFDYRSGRLFWSASVYPEGDYSGTDRILRGLFEIDPATGHTSLLKEYADNIVFTALAVPYLGIDVPDDIQDLQLLPQQPGSDNIAMLFTAPAVTYGQQPYAEGTKFRVHPMLDGRDYYQALLEAGYIGEGKSLTEADFTVEAGKVWTGGPFRLAKDTYHTLGAYVENLADGTVSQTADGRIWVGFDTPVTPQNPTLVYNHERNTATILWDPVTTGIHGGDIDISTLRYIVTRRSDNGTKEDDIAFGITPTPDADGRLSVTDHVSTPMSYTRYGIIALTDPSMSEEARTPYAVVGQPRELPFTSTFNYIGEFHQFITIDANGDGYDDWETPSWYFDPTYGAAFCYLNRRLEPQDDWLITPALQFEEGEQYDVIFQSYGYYGPPAELHLQIAVGPLAEPAVLSRIIYDHTYAVAMPQQFPYEADDVLTRRVTFTAESSDLYIGFHNITTAYDHMSLDNIYIAPHTPSSVSPLPSTLLPPTCYDLQGRPLRHPHHQGLHIENGRILFR